jgi:hypothetical protein
MNSLNTQKIAIVIPIYKSFSELDHTELISLRQCYRVFHTYTFFFVSYKEIDIKAYELFGGDGLCIRPLFFDKSYFKNIDSYSRLLMSFHFYDSFKEYNYILIHQLDVFVFSDKIDHYVKLGYDYIGAPWFENYANATKSSKIIGAGNGGFSFRKVSSFLSVVRLFEFFKKPHKVIKVSELIFHFGSFMRILKNVWCSKKKGIPSVLPWNNSYIEDNFWALTVPAFFKNFKVGSIEDSITFSFEVNPSILFQLNNQNLPMGTHAWQKHDLEFWRPFIEKEGYEL